MEFLGPLAPAAGLVWNYFIVFLLVLTVLVFVHELGHYWVARRCGVRVEVFSIGFGPEIYGITDRHGTRWKFSAIPLGGYVKMYGDQDPSSRPDPAVHAMTDEQRQVSFFHQPLRNRALIVAAGPVANFAFAILVMALLFTTYGQPFTPPLIQTIDPEGAAAEAGFEAGDKVVAVNGTAIDRWEDLLQVIMISPGKSLDMQVERNGSLLNRTVVPRAVQVDDRFGNRQTIGRMGVTRGADIFVRRDPLTAVWQAGRETIGLSARILQAAGQMLTGARDSDELGGPLRIAQVSGELAKTGFVTVVWFMAVLSIQLGLINLFPVPMLDGGHLLFYGIEAVRGRPLGERAQEYGFRIGLALVLTLMVFATWNDLVHFGVNEFVVKLLS
jgi:regulator of sigma E protease